MAIDTFKIDFDMNDKLFNVRMLEFLHRVKFGARKVADEQYEFTKRTLPSIIRQNFVQQGRPKWEKRRDNNPWPILVKYGDLYERAIRPRRYDLLNRKAIKWKAMVGIVGSVHQQGLNMIQTVNGKKRKMFIPARPFFTFPPDGSAEREFLKQLSEYAIQPFTRRSFWTTYKDAE